MLALWGILTPILIADALNPALLAAADSRLAFMF